MANFQPIDLVDLRLDQRNYKTGPQTTQRNAIRAIIEDQKNQLTNLAADLLDVGLSPGEPIWVTPNLEEEGSYTVLEGNRRVAALKILETPALADGTIVEEDFNELAKRYASNRIETLDTQLFESRD